MTPGYLEILNDSLDIMEDDFLFDFFGHCWWHLCRGRCLCIRRENWGFVVVVVSQTHDKAFKYNANNYKLMYPAV